MRYALTLAPFAVAIGLMVGGIMELFWPFLMLSAAIAAWWNWRVGLLLFSCVALVQVPKVTIVDPAQLWVFWAAIYITLGVLSGLYFSIVRETKALIGSATALIVGLMFLSFYAEAPIRIAHTLTELPFMAGLLAAVHYGDGGIRKVLGFAPCATNGSNTFGLVRRRRVGGG